LSGIGTPPDYISAVVDRIGGQFEDQESKYMDFKEIFSTSDERSVGELARDILAFSNTSGGILIGGVTDEGKVIGHAPIDYRGLRERLGPFLGTFVDYEIGATSVNVSGHEVSVPYIFVPRSIRSHPNFLRKDIPLRGNFARKVKYLRGSLFFRDGNSTRVEPAGGEIEARAAELRFSSPTPRIGNSFLVEEDKPGVRIYAHLNDRFFGRDQEVDDLLSRFDDPRGRGISIAGMGGIGKTELAIEVVKRAYHSKRFKHIYSGSAKRSLYSAAGVRETDPCFLDFPGFLRDLGAWMGLDFRIHTPIEEMNVACLGHLKQMPRPLLFVDNLETVQDHRVFSFLDKEVPSNVWLLTTSRVHKVKDYLHAKQLDFMLPGDAARLLRHELKRQGMKEYADLPIDVLESRAINLQRHPLMIRWYAWSCKREPHSWNKTIPRVPPRSDVESFCVGQTLQSLSPVARKILAAISVTEDQSEITPECLGYVAGASEAELDVALHDIESAGLVSGAVDPQTGQISYTTSPMANSAAKELARKNDWEREFGRGFKNYQVACGGDSPPDPLVKNLIEFEPNLIKSLTSDEIRELKSRIERVLARPHAYHNQLLALDAECERHSGHLLSADSRYREAADAILNSGKPIDLKSARILLEAATVARAAFQTEPQLKRAISYLRAIQDHDLVPLRVFGMLVEMSARVGDADAYDGYLSKGNKIRNADRMRFTSEQLEAFDDAVARAHLLRKNWKSPRTDSER